MEGGLTLTTLPVGKQTFSESSCLVPT